MFEILRKQDLVPETIEKLVREHAEETRTLEFKEELPQQSDGATKEFLSDVTSFANASGGVLLFGVSERDAAGNKTGEAQSVKGLPGTGDSVRLKLESQIRSGIEPRIPGIHLEWIPTNQGAVLAVWIPRSWAAPHMVAFKGTSRFYSRNSAGKYQLDVHEIRAQFDTSRAGTLAVRNFLDERIGRLLAGDAPVGVDAGPLLVLHLLPGLTDLSTNRIDLAEAQVQDWFPLHGASSLWATHCFDGLAVHATPPREPGVGYTLLFRSGAVEAVASLSIAENNTLYPESVEKLIVSAVERYGRLLVSKYCDWPLILSTALVGVRGVVGPESGRRRADQIMPVTRDVVPLPDLVLEEDPGDIPGTLRPMFDALSQALGSKRSLSFKGDKWEPGHIERW